MIINLVLQLNIIYYIFIFCILKQHAINIISKTKNVKDKIIYAHAYHHQIDSTDGTGIVVQLNENICSGRMEENIFRQCFLVTGVTV